MTRGNQRDTDRKKREKDLRDKKHKNNMSGAEFQRTKEAQAAIMQEKQRKAEEKKAAEAAKK
ncbi:hypothetical protein Egran_05114 [Elaphomyces granulatus]|uniref:Small EDRK-rich factor-like N-terminal domain-containing protein n=1 Tax=Elaphomyces granulatus TaxID=519963 RepID=A0A232LSL9_9EURO|nr:hypothetical protein Egran_05114 [Elaphomyces granulatus]